VSTIAKRSARKGGPTKGDEGKPAPAKAGGPADDREAELERLREGGLVALLGGRRHVTGSVGGHFSEHLIGCLKQTIPHDVRDEHGFSALMTVLEGLRDTAPRDPLEGMLAAQMVGVHAAAMECLRRAMAANATLEGREMNLGQANRLVRSYAALLGALDQHRGKGRQVVRVEHVTVNAGGRAIVGAVDHRRGKADGESDEPAPGG
jgi:hypothetical protein